MDLAGRLQPSLLKTNNINVDLLPSEVALPLWSEIASDEATLADSAIMIPDFGEAYSPSITKRLSAHTPVSLVPPETRFLDPNEDEHLSFPAEI